MTSFDPLKVASEELAGLVHLHNMLTARSRETELELFKIEAEHNALVKVEGFHAWTRRGSTRTRRVLAARGRGKSEMTLGEVIPLRETAT